jgi:uncharacterized protein (DUF2336 family)
MQPIRSFVREVEGAIASGQEGRRLEVLRQLTTLFIEQSPQLGEQHVTVFDEVIHRLASEIEFRARVELSERLADIANAPRKTVRNLALDEDIQVAGPVLVRSPRLDEADLLEVAQNRGQDHLLVLSTRKHLTEAVTDVIVTRGDERVVQTVAGNETARFSPYGFDTLAAKAEADDRLQSILQSRKDVPPEQMHRIVEAAKAKARDGLAETVGADAALLAEALETGAEQIAGRGSMAMVEDLAQAQEAIDRLMQQGAFGEDEIVALLEADRLPEAITGLARLANLPPDVVSRAYSAPHYDPILFIVRGLRFGWPTFKLLLTVKSGRTPPDSLLRSAFASFENLSVATAQRVMRFVAAKDRVARG